MHYDREIKCVLYPEATSQGTGGTDNSPLDRTLLTVNCPPFIKKELLWLADCFPVDKASSETETTLTLCRLNELPHTIYWKILISI